MLFSVVIPTCNRNDMLALCLDRLTPGVQTMDVSAYEVIVSDDGRNNEAKTLIESRYPWARWTEGPKRGPAANRNNGTLLAAGDWLVFIDDDCIPHLNLIEAYQKEIIADKSCMAFEGRIYVDRPQSSFLEESPINEAGGLFWSCNICINKNSFKALNGFDEHFLYASMEDVDLFLRIRKSGITHKFVYNAAVLHPWRINNQLFWSIINRDRSQQYFLSKHPKERERINALYYLKAFFIFIKFTFLNAVQFRFSGFLKKVCCDFLQIYFAFKYLFIRKN